MTTATQLSPGRKLQIIRDCPKARRMWDNDLTRDEKKFVLAALEIGLTDNDWLLQVIHDARQMRKDASER